MDPGTEERKTLQCFLIPLDDGHQDIVRQQYTKLLVVWALLDKTLEEFCTKYSSSISDSVTIVSLDLALSAQSALTSSSIFPERGRIFPDRRRSWQSRGIV